MLANVAYLWSTDDAEAQQRLLPSSLLPQVIQDPGLPATEADSLVDALTRGNDMEGMTPRLVQAYKAARPKAAGPMIIEAKVLMLGAFDPRDRTILGPEGRDQMAAAGKLLEQAAELSPEDPRPPTLMLLVLMNLDGDPEQFEKYFDRAMALNPDKHRLQSQAPLPEETTDPVSQAIAAPSRLIVNSSAISHVPDSNGVVERAGSKSLAITGKTPRVDRPFVPVERVQRLARIDLPESNGPVVTRRGKQSPVRGKIQRQKRRRYDPRGSVWATAIPGHRQGRRGRSETLLPRQTERKVHGAIGAWCLPAANEGIPEGPSVVARNFA